MQFLPPIWDTFYDRELIRNLKKKLFTTALFETVSLGLLYTGDHRSWSADVFKDVVE